MIFELVGDGVTAPVPFATWAINEAVPGTPDESIRFPCGPSKDIFSLGSKIPSRSGSAQMFVRFGSDEEVWTTKSTDLFKPIASDLARNRILLTCSAAE